jgi:hypothetical protein
MAHIPKGGKLTAAGDLRMGISQPDRELSGEEMAQPMDVMQSQSRKTADFAVEADKDMLPSISSQKDTGNKSSRKPQRGQAANECFQEFPEPLQGHLTPGCCDFGGL